MEEEILSKPDPGIEVLNLELLVSERLRTLDELDADNAGIRHALEQGASHTRLLDNDSCPRMLEKLTLAAEANFLMRSSDGFSIIIK